MLKNLLLNSKYGFFLLLLFCSTAFINAQSFSKFSSRESGWWTLGLDAGAAYQTADVRTKWNGGGFGLTLGKNLAYRPGGMFSFDARGRLLLSRTYGSSGNKSYGIAKNPALNGTRNSTLNYLLDKSNPLDSSFVYHNYRHGMGELGLEGVLTFNRLRERTGVVFALFGGIGLDLYRTRLDQLDANGKAYNYLNVSSGIANVEDLRDGTYETAAEGFDNSSIKVGMMPGAGFELGYQVAPRFVIGIGHKITFSRTDLLDGQSWTDNNVRTGNNDWHHYTNLHLRWDLGRRQNRQDPPEIEITWPGANPSTTASRDGTLRARIKNVQNYSDIQCTLNGGTQAFNFRKGELSGNLRLREGRNEVRIVATNPAGRDEESVIINVVDDRVTPPPPPPPPSGVRPEVRFTQPSRSPFNSDRDNINVAASIRNVSNRRDVRLTVNGTNADFSFSEGLEANVRLREGRNIIRVEATNNAGSASDEIEVNYKANEPVGNRPLVRITQPSSSNETTKNKSYTLRATVENVDTRDDITLLVNGSKSSEFSYDTRTKVLVASLTLQNRENDITIRGRNRSGEGEASCIIKLTTDAPPSDKKPEVNITAPAEGTTVTNAAVSLKAKVTNIADKSEVKVTLNGVEIRNVDYNKLAKTIEATLTLKEGDNVIVVRATNAAGSAEDNVKVRYSLGQTKPEVRITAPAEGTNLNVPETRLKATVTNIADKSEVKVTLNGVEVRNVDYNKLAKTIDAALTLKEGDNVIMVRATNAGGSDEDNVKVRYTASKPPPEVTITTPANNSEQRTAESKLSATILNVADKTEIKVTQNGRSVAFDFNPRVKSLSANLTLAEGNNTIVVVAKNSAGSDEGTVSVKYTKGKSPVVTIQSPANESTTDVAAVTLIGRIENVMGNKNVSVLQNGRKIEGITLDRTGNMKVSTVLSEGKNTFVVKATNADGSDEKTVNVTYNAKPSIQKPSIAFTNPGRPGSTVKNSTFTMTATVQRVEKTGLRLTFNGKAVRQFGFDTKSGIITANLSLKEGKNTLKIDATNSGGDATASSDLTYVKQGGAVPDITIQSASQPVVSPFSPNLAKTEVLATTQNVNNQNQIKATIDGTAIVSITFDAATGKMSFITDVKRGAPNLIEITVTTDAGTDKASVNVKFD